MSDLKRCDQPVKFNFYKKTVLATIAEAIIEINPYFKDIQMNDISTTILKMSEIFDNSKQHKKGFSVSNPYLYITEYEFSKWLKDSLMSIQEFRNLNLSYEERENNINVDDPNRFSISFHSIYDKEQENSWKQDFIDLEAVQQNICYKISKKLIDEDCFLCKHSCETSCTECDNCINNPKFSNHYEVENRPFGDNINRWCSVGCSNGKAICCYDCNNKDSCEDRCCGSHFLDNNITCSALVERKDCGENE